MVAHGFVSPLLRRLQEEDIVDELRVIVAEEQRTTAYFTFSSQMRPSLHQLRSTDQERAGPRPGSGKRDPAAGRAEQELHEKFVPHLTFAD